MQSYTSLAAKANPSYNILTKASEVCFLIIHLLHSPTMQSYTSLDAKANPSYNILTQASEVYFLMTLISSR